jgi:formamidopyrimidine-DNA glycosylase
VRSARERSRSSSVHLLPTNVESRRPERDGSITASGNRPFRHTTGSFWGDERVGGLNHPALGQIFQMPELPEVEHLRRTLERRLLGAGLDEVRFGPHDVLEPRGGSVVARSRRLLAGATIDRLLRHGKQMALVATDGRVLVVHLGMSGRMTFDATPPQPTRGQADRHAHVAWRIRGGGSDGRRATRRGSGEERWLVFRDPRRFGSLTSLESPEALAERWRALGPDALLCEPIELTGALAGLRRHVKAALLDQAVLAGVGNIYADESLFRAGIHPNQSLASLTAQKLERLVNSLRETLVTAVGSGGSSLRDYVDAETQLGSYQLYHLVYGRAGEACPTCGTTFRRLTAAGRTTVLCPSCQPLIHKRERRRSKSRL